MVEPTNNVSGKLAILCSYIVGALVLLAALVTAKNSVLSICAAGLFVASIYTAMRGAWRLTNSVHNNWKPMVGISSITGLWGFLFLLAHIANNVFFIH